MLMHLRILRLQHRGLERRVAALGRERLADQLRQRAGEKRLDAIVAR